MDISTMKTILEIVNGVKIEELALIPTENGTLVSGIAPDKTAAIFTEIPEKIEDLPMGILSVKGMLSRMNLFDLEKVSVEPTNKEKSGEPYVAALSFKQGRKKSYAVTTHPKMLRVPKEFPDTEPCFQIGLSKEYINYLKKVVSSIQTVSRKEVFFGLEYDGGDEAELSIIGDDDTFREPISAIGVEGEKRSMKISWEVSGVILTLTQAIQWIQEDEDVLIDVDHLGVGKVSVGMLEVLLPPASSS